MTRASGKIYKLTAVQRARLTPYAQEWIDRVLRTGPCTPAERAVVEDGMRRCYELAGIPWHGRVVWVQSPFVAVAAGLIAAHGRADATECEVSRAVRRALGFAVRDAVEVAALCAAHTAVGAAVCDVVGAMVQGAVGVAVGDAVDGAIGTEVEVAVRGGMREGVDVSVHGTIDIAIARAVDDTVRGAVYDVVDTAVRDAVYGAISADSALRDALRVAARDVTREWRLHFSPWWAWDAWRAACIEILGITSAQHLVDALRDANGAGWWWPHRDYVIVSDRPTVIHRERVGPDGWGSHRLHNPTGPAIAWGDGWAIWAWHGVVVPPWVIEDCTIDRIQAEANTEIRRCAIEAYGWERYLHALGATPVSVEPDPGNPGHHLELYDLPTSAQVYGEPVRLLVMNNASLDRDGTRRRFAETVPAEITSAVEAAAWQFGVPVESYQELARAT